MTNQTSDRPMLSLFWMTGSSLAFSIMAVFVKRLGTAIPQIEQVFFRSVINFSLVALVMLVRKEAFYPPALRSKKMRQLLFFRGVAGLGGVSCLFYTLHHLPYPVAMMLGWCSPIFVLFYSKLLASKGRAEEDISRRSLFAIGLALIGLFFLLNPLGGRLDTPGAQITLLGVMIGLLGAASSGGAYIAVRAATAQVGANLIVLYFMGVSTLITAPLMIGWFRVPSWNEGIDIFALGAAATVAQISMTQGYRFAPAPLVSTMSLLNAAFSAFFGWWIFHERLVASQWVGLLVLGLAIASLSGGRRRAGPRNKVHHR